MIGKMSLRFLSTHKLLTSSSIHYYFTYRKCGTNTFDHQRPLPSSPFPIHSIPLMHSLHASPFHISDAISPNVSATPKKFLQYYVHRTHHDSFASSPVPGPVITILFFATHCVPSLPRLHLCVAVTQQQCKFKIRVTKAALISIPR